MRPRFCGDHFMEAKPAEHMPHTAPVTRDEVEAELISSLYKRTRPLLLANIGAMSLLTMSLWSSANTFYLLSWAIALFSWTMLRFALAPFRWVPASPAPCGAFRSSSSAASVPNMRNWWRRS